MGKMKEVFMELHLEDQLVDDEYQYFNWQKLMAEQEQEDILELTPDTPPNKNN